MSAFDIGSASTSAMTLKFHLVCHHSHTHGRCALIYKRHKVVRIGSEALLNGQDRESETDCLAKCANKRTLDVLTVRDGTILPKRLVGEGRSPLGIIATG